MIETAWAQAAGGGSAGISFIPLILIFAVMYFLLIRPQQKRQKMHRGMIANLKRGDKIITGGGFYAKVTNVIDDQTLEVEIASNVKVRISRVTVSECLNPLAPTNDNKPEQVDSPKKPKKNKKQL